MNTLIKLSALSLLFIACSEKPKNVQSNTEEVSQADVATKENSGPTFAENLRSQLHSIPIQRFKISASEGKVIELESGVKITVPKDAFLSPDGSIYKGDVTLKVEDMTSLKAIVQSGLRMDAKNEQGVYEPFASAGMIGIHPEEEVSVNAENKIQVEILASNTENYPLWRYNTVANEWNQYQRTTQIRTVQRTISENSSPTSQNRRADCYLGNEEDIEWGAITHKPDQFFSVSTQRRFPGKALEGVLYKGDQQVYAMTFNQHDLPVGGYYTFADELAVPRPRSIETDLLGWEAPLIVPASDVPGPTIAVNLNESKQYVPEFEHLAALRFKPYAESDRLMLEDANLNNVELRRGGGPFYDLYLFEGRYDKSHRKVRVVPVYTGEITPPIQRANELIDELALKDSLYNDIMDHISCECLNYALNDSLFEELAERYDNVAGANASGFWRQWRLELRAPSVIVTVSGLRQQQPTEATTFTEEVNTRFLEIDQFGYFNCDRFYRVPSVSAQFIAIHSGQIIDTLSAIRLIDVVDNAVIDYNSPSRENQKIGVDREYKFIVMTATEDIFYGTVNSSDIDNNSQLVLNLESGNLEEFLDNLALNQT